jgi:hypothetical protein
VSVTEPVSFDELDRTTLAEHPRFDVEFAVAFDQVLSRVLTNACVAAGKAQGIGETLEMLDAISGALAVIAERHDGFDGIQAPVDQAFVHLRELQRVFARTGRLLWAACVGLGANGSEVGVRVIDQQLVARADELDTELGGLCGAPVTGHVKAMEVELVSEMLKLVWIRTRDEAEPEEVEG